MLTAMKVTASFLLSSTETFAFSIPVKKKMSWERKLLKFISPKEKTNELRKPPKITQAAVKTRLTIVFSSEIQIQIPGLIVNFNDQIRLD